MFLSIASLAYADGFCQAQVGWLRETRQDGLSAPGPYCEETLSVRNLSGKTSLFMERSLLMHAIGYS